MPSKLEKRQGQYGIPETPYLPMGKNVLVFRLPSETRTAGGLYIADVAQEPRPMGVLVAAGLAALDIMADHLVELGDIVWFGRFAGWEREIERDPEGKGRQILQMKVDDMLGSVDALERRRDYVIRLVPAEDGNPYRMYVRASDVPEMVARPANDNDAARAQYRGGQAR